MKSFSMFCYTVCTVFVVGSVTCDSADNSKNQANRRSISEFGQGLYAPSYHAHYAPSAYHGHYAPAETHYHAHGYAAPAHYHHAPGYSVSGHYHHAHGYAPSHLHYYNHETTVHGFRHQPVVYQSVVHAYPTATTVVHKPVAHPVPVPVARPVAVEVPRPYPVPVNRPYPVPVIKPVAVPVAQPYPVTVYKPYPVPVYRPVPVAVVARPAATAVHYAARIPSAVRVPFVRYPSYATHSHAYAPHYHATAAYPAAYPAATATYPAAAATYPGVAPTYPAASPSSYLQQLAAVRAAASVAAAGEYDVNEAVAQQQTLQDDYSYLHEQQDAAADIHHHHHHHDHDHVLDQDSGIAGSYPSLTTDETFKTSLGVPNTDYTGKKKK